MTSMSATPYGTVPETVGFGGIRAISASGRRTGVMAAWAAWFFAGA